ncbi:AmmeMemoRadiSam system protein B [Calditrichota bacterium]
MRQIVWYLTFISLLNIGCRAESGNTGKEWKNIRTPAVSGAFYPDDPVKLEAAIRGFIEDAVKPQTGKPLAIIAPHAGYIYSGQISADAYHQASDHKYDVVVILGTNHTTAGFNGVSVYRGNGYKTPLGVAEIDREIVSKLLHQDPRFYYDERLHQKEHSVEVQVPFVQVLFPGMKIVAAVIGSPDIDMCRDFAKLLAESLSNRNALIIASSDLSHYPQYEYARDVDRKTLDAIETFDPVKVQESIAELEKSGTTQLSTCACGEAPIITAMMTAKLLGATRAKAVSYANSGNVLVGNKSRVVGYGAVSMFKDGDQTEEKPDRSGFSPSTNHEELSEDDRKALLKLARNTIIRYLESETLPLLRDNLACYRLKRGVFVTLNKDGQLRGCIGHMTDELPLNEVVARMAIQAAFNDYRFDAVKLEEMKDIKIEISVLTPYERIAAPDEIVVGRDGVMIQKAGHSAVYLPQVAPEQGWNREQTLNHLCKKAGLPESGWREGAELFTFKAIVFHESDD